MKRVLVMSVGGSAAPIVNAIRSSGADFVYFFCSSGPRGSTATVDGPHDPCGDKRTARCPECGHEYCLGSPKGKAIVSQTGLGTESYEIAAVDDPDDLNACYLKLLGVVESIKARYPQGCEVTANYTGGTKTMSVALALVGVLTQQWDLSLNVGPRQDLIQVRSGDAPVMVDKWRVFYESQLDGLRRLLDSYHYDFVSHSVSDMLSRPLDRSLQKQLVATGGMCRAFDAWDKFHHEQALELLEPYGARFAGYIINLKRILGRARGATGYDMVSDLMNNAQRRAAQKHYDDAVGRLYRATELLAQTRLEKVYGWKGGEVKLEQLPSRLQAEYAGRVRGGKLILGLREDYDLLHKLDDPVGKGFKQREAEIVNALTQRNYSISAHGLTPLGEQDYLQVREVLEGFMMEMGRQLGVGLEVKQLPTADIIDEPRGKRDV